jgi:cullin 3
MLMDLGKPTYVEDFERHFLAAAADFYAKEAQEFISTCNAPDYLRKVGSQL